MAAFVMVAAMGCGKDGGSDHVSKSKALADRACACKGDQACIDKVQADWEAWETEARKGKKPDDETMKKIEANEDRAEKCAEGGTE